MFCNGYQTESDSYPPERHLKRQIMFNDLESDIISQEVYKLLHKKIIQQIGVHEVKFESLIFICPKCDGCHQMILNCRELNQFIHTQHFKRKL